jgi:hypothetical protein
MDTRFGFEDDIKLYIAANCYSDVKMIDQFLKLSGCCHDDDYDHSDGDGGLGYVKTDCLEPQETMMSSPYKDLFIY